MLFTEPAQTQLSKIISFQLGSGFGQDMAWWISLRVHGSNVCCGLGFGAFRHFCLWASATDLETVSPHELSRKESCSTWRVVLSLQHWHWKAQSQLFLWFLHFFLSMQLPVVLYVQEGGLRSSCLVLTRVCQSPFHPIVWLGIWSLGWAHLCFWSGRANCCFKGQMHFFSSHSSTAMQIFFPNESLSSFTGIWTLRMCDLCERLLQQANPLLLVSLDAQWAANHFLSQNLTFCTSIIPAKPWIYSRFRDNSSSSWLPLLGESFGVIARQFWTGAQSRARLGSSLPPFYLCR